MLQAFDKDVEIGLRIIHEEHAAIGEVFHAGTNPVASLFPRRP